MAVAGSGRCTLRVTDLTAGEVDERPLGLDRGIAFGLQASPDGSPAALAYEGGFGPRARCRFSRR